MNSPTSSSNHRAIIRDATARENGLDLHYEPEIPATLKASEENVLALSYDSFSGEVLVFGRVLELRCLTSGSTAEFLASIGWNRHESEAPVVEIDFEAWIIPAEFSPENPEDLIYRSNRVFVDADTLIKDKLVTYGLGPEYNYLEWLEISGSSGPLPPEKLELLADVITSHRGEQIIEFLKGGGEVPDQLSAPVLRAYKVLSATARSQVAREEQEYVTWEAAEVARQNEDKLQFAELKFDVDAINKPTQNGIASPTDISKRLMFVLPSTHKSRLLYIFASPLSGTEDDWSIEACIVRKARSATMFYAEQVKEIFNITSASSIEAVEKQIIAQIADGSLTQRFRRSA